jgi:hypothetical protein
MHLFIYPSIYLSIYVSIYLYTYLLCIYLFMYLSTYLCLSIYAAVHLSPCLYIYPCICHLYTFYISYQMRDTSRENKNQGFYIFQNRFDAWFGALTAEVMKSPTFCDIIPCSPLKDKQSSACYRLHAGFLFVLFFNSEDGSDMFLRNVG